MKTYKVVGTVYFDVVMEVEASSHEHAMYLARKNRNEVIINPHAPGKYIWKLQEGYPHGVPEPVYSTEI